MIRTQIKSSPLFAGCSARRVRSLSARRKTIRSGWKPFQSFTALPPRYGNVTGAGLTSGAISVKMNAKWLTAQKGKGLIFVWNAMNTHVMNYARSRKKDPIELSCGKPRNGSRKLDTSSGFEKWLITIPAPNVEPSTQPMTSNAERVRQNPVAPMWAGIKMKFFPVCRKKAIPR